MKTTDAQQMQLRQAAVGTTAPGGDRERLAMAARQFESLFTKQLLEALAGTKEEGAFEGMGSSSGLYDQMMHQAVAEQLSRGKGAGVAQMLYRRWTGDDLPADTIRMGPQGLSGAAERAVPDTQAAEPWDVPPVETRPGTLVDDGVTPLREMLPPTGLEPWIDKDLNPPIAAPDYPSGPPSLRAGEANGYQVRTTDHHNRETVPGGRRESAPEGTRPERRRAVAGYQRVIAGGDR